jgi:hypothetical protein
MDLSFTAFEFQTAPLQTATSMSLSFAILVRKGKLLGEGDAETLETIPSPKRLQAEI